LYFTTRKMDYAEKEIAGLFESVRAHKKLVEDYRKQQNAGHSLKVGDIITNSWGYDQTNVDWYRIVKTSNNYVWLQPICANVEETGFMSGRSSPGVDTSNPDPTQWNFRDAKGKIEKHRAQDEHVCMQFGSGSKWHGEAKYCSWYA